MSFSACWRRLAKRGRCYQGEQQRVGHIKPAYINNQGLQIWAADPVESCRIVRVKIRFMHEAWLLLVFSYVQQAAINQSVFFRELSYFFFDLWPSYSLSLVTALIFEPKSAPCSRSQLKNMSVHFVSLQLTSDGSQKDATPHLASTRTRLSLKCPKNFEVHVPHLQK